MHDKSSLIAAQKYKEKTIRILIRKAFQTQKKFWKQEKFAIWAKSDYDNYERWFSGWHGGAPRFM